MDGHGRLDPHWAVLRDEGPYYYRMAHAPNYEERVTYPQRGVRERTVTRTVPVLKWPPHYYMFDDDQNPYPRRGRDDYDRGDRDSPVRRSPSPDERDPPSPKQQTKTTKGTRRATTSKKAPKKKAAASKEPPPRELPLERPPKEYYDDEPLNVAQEKERCCCRYGSCDEDDCGCPKQGCDRPYDTYMAGDWQKGSWFARYKTHANSLKALEYLTERIPKITTHSLENLAKVSSGVQQTIDIRWRGGVHGAVTRQIDVDLRNDEGEEAAAAKAAAAAKYNSKGKTSTSKQKSTSARRN